MEIFLVGGPYLPKTFLQTGILKILYRPHSFEKVYYKKNKK